MLSMACKNGVKSSKLCKFVSHRTKALKFFQPLAFVFDKVCKFGQIVAKWQINLIFIEEGNLEKFTFYLTKPTRSRKKYIFMYEVLKIIFLLPK